MTQLDGVTFTIVAKSGRSIPYMALCQVGQEMAGKSIFSNNHKDIYKMKTSSK